MVFGKVGSFLRVIGWIWLGSGVIAAASALIDGGLLQGDADADAVITAIGTAFSVAVPGFILLAVGSGLRRKAGRAGPGQPMTLRRAISRPGAAIADHNARQLARLEGKSTKRRSKADRIKEVEQALDAAWPDRPSPAPERPGPAPERKGPPTVSGRTGQRRSVIER